HALENADTESVAGHGCVVNLFGTEIGVVTIGQFQRGRFACFDGGAHIAQDGRGAGVGFDATAVATATQGAVEVNNHVAQLSGSVVDAAVEFVVDHDATTHAGAQREENHGIDLGTGAGPPLTIGGGIGVVRQGDR